MENVNLKKGKDYGSAPRKGLGTIGLYRKPKKRKVAQYTRRAPNYHANTETAPGSGVGE